MKRRGLMQNDVFVRGFSVVLDDWLPTGGVFIVRYICRDMATHLGHAFGLD